MRHTIGKLTLIVVLLFTALGGPGLNSGRSPVGLALGPAVVEAQEPPPPTPLWGIADTHNHQFANLGFGGLMIWGDVFRWDDDIAKALPWSDFMAGRYGDVLNYAGDSREPDVSAWSLLYPNVPATCPPGTGGISNPCRGFSIHGAGGLRDLINYALTGNLGHGVAGYPQFDGYPRWNTFTGQQMYYKWLERAWREGGLRLMVMFAVNNEALCKAIDRKAGFTCEDMPAIDRQIQAAKDLERFIDNQHGGPGQGWYRIAYSPAQARQIVADGKLAVVLGIETPSLFGCKVHSDCTVEYVLTELKRYRDMGVRHIYPLHNADNGFGGTGLYNQIFTLNTKVINNEWFDVTDACDPRIDFHLDLLDALQPGGGGSIPAPLVDLVYLILGMLTGDNTTAPRPPQGRNCNARDLQPLGETLIDGMMDLKMIIDVDHLSTETFNDVMARAEQWQYAGVVSSHASFVDLGIPRGGAESMRYEANKLPEELERIRALGGNVGVIIHQGDRSTMREYVRPDGSVPVPYTCGSSSEAWAQAYLYAVDHTQGGAVGFASDMNGLAGVPAPRFGLEACNGDYPLLYFPPGGVTYSNDPSQGLTRMQVGNKIFDYNYDGFANIGLLPDFIQDVRSLGVSEADLAPLYQSAEAYIRMWEQVDPGLADPPNNAPSAHAGGPYLALTGTTVTLQGSGADPNGDPLTFSWDMDGNGVFETSGASTTFAADGPNRDVPVVMRACDSHAAGTQAACTNSRTFVHVRTPGHLYAWGGNNSGQLGVPPSSVAACQPGMRCSPLPISVPDLMDVVDVAAGKWHSLALKSDGTVWAWGGASGSTPEQIGGLSNVVAIAAGSDHSLALKSDGTVWAWGINTFGQLGTGDTDSRSSPVQVPVIGPVTAISAGDGFSLALLDIGGIVGWGSNQSYQLGDQCWLGGDSSLPPAECLSPVVIFGLGGPDIVGIAAGSTWSHALDKNGAVFVQGGVDYETREVRRTPARVGGLTHSIAISAGTHDHVLSLLDSGYVRGYGRNEWGQVTDGCDDGYGFCWPYGVPRGWPARAQWIAVAAGHGHSLALTDEGWVDSWGTNYNGQLGRGGAAMGRITSLGGVIGIAAGYDHSLAIVPTTVSLGYRPDLFVNTLRLPGYCAGLDLCSTIDFPRNLVSEPITFTYTYQHAPSAEGAGGLGTLRYAGSSFTLAARDASGNAVTSFSPSFPIRLHYQEQDWLWTEISDEETLDIYRWDAATNQWQTFQPGWHWPEQNDVGIYLDHLDPITEFALLGERGNRAPVGHPGGPYLALTGTTLTLHGTGTDPDDDAFSFEWDLDGDGVYEAPGQDVPFAASGPSQDVPVVLRMCDERGACSYSRSFVHIRVLGRILAWGLNDSGQLGVHPSAVSTCGDSIYPCSPTAIAVPGLQEVVDVAAGGWSSFALTSDGRVWEWGSMVGSTPTPVAGLDRMVAVAAGYDHVLALQDDGSVWAWGENDYGQIGIGDVGDQDLPVRVPGIGPAVAVAAGNKYSLALLDDGSIWGWGDNRWYQLGDQCYDPDYGYHFPQECWSAVLVPYLGGRYTVGISAGTTWSVAWDDNGTVRLQGGWDPNRDLEPRLTPEQMDGLANSILVSSSTGDHILSRRQDGTVWAYGNASRGQLGSGCTEPFRCYTPVQVPELPMYPGAVLAADLSSFALDEDGAIWAWGDNWAGQLGDGEYGGYRSQPVQAAGVTGVAVLASGGKHALVIVPGGATPPPGTVSVTAQPDVATSLALPQERGSLDLPAGVVTVPTTFTYTELAGPSEAPAPGTLQFAGLSFTLEARDAAGDPVATFPVPFTLVLNYRDTDWQAAGIPEEWLLNLFWWDAATAQWRGVLRCDGCAHDMANNRLTAQLDHLTEFALLGWTDNTPPDATHNVNPAANEDGWNRTEVSVTLDAVDGDDGSGVQSLTYEAAGAQPIASTTLNGATATIDLSAEGQTTLTYAARDNAGNVSALGAVTTKIDNTAPTVSITAPEPFAVLAAGTTLAFDANDTVSGIQTDSATLTNGSTTQPVSSGDAIAQAGVYTLIVEATDRAGNEASETRYFVVYDPSGGFVTGGGWIHSPAGAYVPDPALAGKATFGFVSKYQKGATVPTGNTEFQFKTGDLNFHSVAYHWLVVAGPKAQLKGLGTINGSGEYGFLLTAVDGQLNGGGGADRFRIKIWDPATDAVIYDNQMGDGDDTDSATVIGGGAIVIHK